MPAGESAFCGIAPDKSPPGPDSLIRDVSTDGRHRPLARLRQTLGHRLKLLRVERDWSLKDLSARTNLSVSQISSIERGAHLPSMESLLAICRAFEKLPSEILSTISF